MAMNKSFMECKTVYCIHEVGTTALSDGADHNHSPSDVLNTTGPYPTN